MYKHYAATLSLALTLAIGANGALADLISGDEVESAIESDWTRIIDGREDIFGEAMRALEINDLEKAEQAIAQILSAYPEHPGAWEMHGTLKMRQGDLPTAETSLRRSLSLLSDNAIALTKLGSVRLKRGDRPDSVKFFEKAYQVDSSYPLANFYLARIRREEHDLPGAIRHYKVALIGLPGAGSVRNELAAAYYEAGDHRALVDLLAPYDSNVETQLTLAAGYLELGDIERARALIVRVESTLGKEDSRVRVLSAIADRKSGNLERALTEFQDLADDYPKDYRSQYQLGLTALAAGRWTVAIKAMEVAEQGLTLPLATKLEVIRARYSNGDRPDAIEAARAFASESKAPLAQHLLVQLHAANGQLDRALDASAHMVAAFPDFVTGNLTHINLLGMSGQPDLAHSFARDAVDRLPQTPQIAVAYSGLLLEKHQFAEAETVLTEALERHPDDTTLAFQLASAYQQAGKRDEAEQSYRNLLVNNPNQVGSLNNLAMLLADESSQIDEALVLAKHAYQISPSAPEIQDTLGWLLYLSGNHKDGLAFLESSYKAQRNDASVACRLGIAFASQKNADQARPMLDQCLAGSPDTPLKESASTVLLSL